MTHCNWSSPDTSHINIFSDVLHFICRYVGNGRYNGWVIYTSSTFPWFEVCTHPICVLNCHIFHFNSSWHFFHVWVSPFDFSNASPLLYWKIRPKKSCSLTEWLLARFYWMIIVAMSMSSHPDGIHSEFHYVSRDFFPASIDAYRSGKPWPWPFRPSFSLVSLFPQRVVLWPNVGFGFSELSSYTNKWCYLPW